MKKIILFCILSVLFSCLVHGKSDELIIITVTEEHNIREIAKEYLKDPDLWPDILHANNLELAHEIKPGMELKIPARIILKVHNTLNELQQLIKKASETGARIFAKEDIGAAILNQNKALEDRAKGKWQQALKMAESGIAAASLALKKSLANRDVPAEAVLENSKGRVQKRNPSDLYWKDAEIKAGLIEKEKVRTLSESFADIRFKDQSRIRLNENAQIMIKQMRTDRLKKKEKSGVVLYGGDIYALLGGKQKKDDFDIAVSGVSTKIDSENFWVDKQRQTTRFANYDGEIEVSSKGGTVILKKNQGTLVKGSQKPTVPKDLLPAPDPVFPDNFSSVYKQGVELKWKHTDKAVAYWLEISKDESFNDIYFNKKDIDENAYFFPLPSEDGIYYWRLAAFDSHGFPGPKSSVRFLKILKDDKPPYALILSPQENRIIRNIPVKIEGKTEADAKVTFKNISVPVNSEGHFVFDSDLKPGTNIINIEIKDKAGNTHNIKHSLVYMPDHDIHINYDSLLKKISDRHFISTNSFFTLKGEISDNNGFGISLSIKSESGTNINNSALTDENGKFQINIPLTLEKEEFTLTASLATGFTAEDRFIIEKDIIPPVIEIDTIPFSYTGSETLTITGRIKDGEKLTCNQESVTINPEGGFEHKILLKPGKNIINLAAQDIAGNIAVWKKEVFLDREPPEFEDVKFSKQYSSGSEDIFIEVKAKDQSGMKAGALFKVRVGDFEYRGYLRLCDSKNCYKGKAVIPDKVKGRIKLTYLKLEDYQGNIKEYDF